MNIEAGKFYKTAGGHKAECLMVSGQVAFMRIEKYGHAYCRRHFLVSAEEGDEYTGFHELAIVAEWKEPFLIHWEMVPPEIESLMPVLDGILLSRRIGYDKQNMSWANHIAPGWRGHIGETFKRDKTT